MTKQKGKTVSSDAAVMGALYDLVEECGSQKECAKRLDVSPQYLGDILKERRDLTQTFVRKLGFEMIVTYKYVGDDK